MHFSSIRFLIFLFATTAFLPISWAATDCHGIIGGVARLSTARQEELRKAIEGALGPQALSSTRGSLPEEGKIQPSNAVYEYLFPNSVPDKARLMSVFREQFEKIKTESNSSGMMQVETAFLAYSPSLHLQFVAVKTKDIATRKEQTHFLQAHVANGEILKSEPIASKVAYGALGPSLALVHHPAGLIDITETGEVSVLDTRRTSTTSKNIDSKFTYHKNRIVDGENKKKKLTETEEDMNCKVPRRLGKSFANINFVGPCNMFCTFCIGNTGAKNEMMQSMDTRKIPAQDIPNIRPFLQQMKEEKVPWIMLTGLNTEPLLYEDLDNLTDLIHSYGLKVALRSNALTALKRMDSINRLDKATFSLHTLNPDTSQKLLGIRRIPPWEQILKKTKIPVKINIVVCPENKDEISSILQKLSEWGVKRVSLRNPFGYWGVPREEFGQPTGWYANNPIHRYKGMELTLWETSETTVDSYNFIAGNGELLDEYGIFDVIKGIGAPANAKKLKIYQNAKPSEPEVIQIEK